MFGDVPLVHQEEGPNIIGKKKNSLLLKQGSICAWSPLNNFLGSLILQKAADNVWLPGYVRAGIKLRGYSRTSDHSYQEAIFALQKLQTPTN